MELNLIFASETLIFSLMSVSNSFTYSFTCPFTQSFTCPFTHSFIHSLTHTLTCTHSLRNSFICMLTGDRQPHLESDNCFDCLWTWGVHEVANTVFFTNGSLLDCKSVTPYSRCPVLLLVSAYGDYLQVEDPLHIYQKSPEYLLLRLWGTKS